MKHIEQCHIKARCSSVGLFLLLFAVSFPFVSCKQGGVIRLYGEAQGTYYTIQYTDIEGRNLQPQIDSILHAFDQVASLWVENSEIRRVNANISDSVGPIFEQLYKYSEYVNRYANGAFDCRIGKIVQAWGFSFRQRTEPDSVELAAMLEAARCHVKVEKGKVDKECPATELDFNAIAQGYSVDIIASFFDSLDIKNYLIDIGGEVIARGKKPDGMPWRVGIERPSESKDDAPVVATSIALTNQSIVTSGSYRKYYERDGVRYSHTINPRTGRPVEHSMLSASVVATECWFADAMATAYMVMGLDSALAFIEQHAGEEGTDAVYFIYDDHGELRHYSSPAFQVLQNK